MDDLLGVIENESAEEKETSVEPEVVHSWAGVEHLNKTDANQSSAAHSKSTSPLQELFTGRGISDSTKTTNSESSCHESVIDDWHGGHVDQRHH